MSAKRLAVALVVAVSLMAAATALSAGPSTRPRQHAVATAPAATQGATAPAARQFHRFRGTVTSRNQTQRWFRMHTTTNSSVRIYTSRTTQWDDRDWGDMRYGNHIDVRAYHNHGRWMASTMQNWHDSWNNDGDDHGHMGW